MVINYAMTVCDGVNVHTVTMNSVYLAPDGWCVWHEKRLGKTVWQGLTDTTARSCKCSAHVFLWTETISKYIMEVKQSHYKPGQALSVPAGWGSQISRQSVHEGGKVVSSTHRPLLPQEIFLVIISVRGWVDPSATVRPEGLCQCKSYNDTIGNRTRAFPSCSAVLQPTASPRVL